MPSRIAARLLTGPFAFLVAGIIDLLAFVVASVLSRTRGRRKPR